jgi:predicted ATPase
MESYRAVQLTGGSEVCIVSGYGGAGKTRLVREALDKMVQEGALTAYAKFDQFNEDVPFTAMVISSVMSLKSGTMHLRHCKTIILQERRRSELLQKHSLNGSRSRPSYASRLGSLT